MRAAICRSECALRYAGRRPAVSGPSGVVLRMNSSRNLCEVASLDSSRRPHPFFFLPGRNLRRPFATGFCAVLRRLFFAAAFAWWDFAAVFCLSPAGFARPEAIPCLSPAGFVCPAAVVTLLHCYRGAPPRVTDVTTVTSPLPLIHNSKKGGRHCAWKPPAKSP